MNGVSSAASFTLIVVVGVCTCARWYALLAVMHGCLLVCVGMPLVLCEVFLAVCVQSQRAWLHVHLAFMVARAGAVLGHNNKRSRCDRPLLDLLSTGRVGVKIFGASVPAAECAPFFGCVVD